MRVLFLGGTGIISSATAELAVARGMDVAVLNRGLRGPPPPGARLIEADVHDAPATSRAVAAAAGGDHGRPWDAVVDFIAYTPADVAERIALCQAARVRQYIFISSASAYQKPASHHLITESTPLSNPFWQYARDKIACEDALVRAFREAAFPVTIVRPSYTYDDTVVPLAFNPWGKTFTVVDRLRRGVPVIVPGDGLTPWTMTHASDFAKGLVGLIGHQGATGHAFHITSDEVLTWNQIYEAVADAAGAPPPRLIHVASDFLAACLPGDTDGLLGDKAWPAIFDNTKIKRFVPEFVATTRFRDGIRRTLTWFDADPTRRIVDRTANATWDRLIAAYEGALEAARRAVLPPTPG
jgi:nucleoside-diphosphate-sugar epimerase